mmetsp:Transcript_113334/g.206170  ORF Transcript_113334/g.206170 Transcript_113334/m.206170 type:complete len:91 (+) Transcript_113334:353-625(+)
MDALTEARLRSQRLRCKRSCGVLKHHLIATFACYFWARIVNARFIRARAFSSLNNGLIWSTPAQESWPTNPSEADRGLFKFRAECQEGKL